VHCRPGLRPVGAGLLVEPGLFLLVHRTGLLLQELAFRMGRTAHRHERALRPVAAPRPRRASSRLERPTYALSDAPATQDAGASPCGPATLKTTMPTPPNEGMSRAGKSLTLRTPMPRCVTPPFTRTPPHPPKTPRPVRVMPMRGSRRIVDVVQSFRAGLRHRVGRVPPGLSGGATTGRVDGRDMTRCPPVGTGFPEHVFDTFVVEEWLPAELWTRVVQACHPTPLVELSRSHRPHCTATSR